jgi:cell division protein FtsN
MESGLELVLDNRKLIIAFVVLFAICGCFFIVGFIEGKRQGYQEGALAAAESAPASSGDMPEPQSSATFARADTVEQSAKKEEAAVQKLDWYKNVKKEEAEPSLVKKEEPAKKPKTQTAPANSAPGTYSVQVGAFRHKNEVEIKAQAVRAKGYECRIEAPRTPDQLYLLKVGKFSSRADAVSLQQKLKKDGFNSFVKAN